MGNELWIGRYDTPAIDNALALTIDSFGNIYVSGMSDSGPYDPYIPEGYWDYATIAYDTSGNELWVARYDGPTYLWDIAYSIAVDASGDVYVSGSSFGNGSNFDYTTIKYSQKTVFNTTIDIDPDTLNLKSKGKWITAYITLPEDYDVNEIDISTIMLEDTIPARWGDIQGDALMIKFVRSDVEDLIGEPNDDIELTVTGEFYDGTPFTGSDIIRVIAPPR
jgi:hypothetical protein